MKHTSDIAKELRAMGYSFGQVSLVNDLLSFEPAMKIGRMNVYQDEVVGLMAAKYAIERPITAPKEPEPDLTQEALLDLRKMMQAICTSLQITV